MHADTALRAITSSRIVAGMRGAFPPDVALHTSEILMGEGINCFEMLMNSQQPIERHASAESRIRTTMPALAWARCSAWMRQIKRWTPARISSSRPLSSPKWWRRRRRGMRWWRLASPRQRKPWRHGNLGVPLLKLFPIGALGVDYFAAIYGPLGHMRFMCNGAMNDQNARELVQAGAVAVGMGGWLVGDGSWGRSRLRSRARILVNAVGGGD